MRKSTKAVLLSALVFPGLGHFYLKRPVVGTLLAAIALGSLYLLVSAAADTALQITAQLQRGDIQPDMAAISQLINGQSAGAESRSANAASLALLVCWLVGILDAYRVGRGSDRNDAA